MSGVLTDNRPASKLEASIRRDIAGGIQVSPGTGLLLTNVDQVMEFSKLMALMGQAVPKHCHNNAGVCLAICLQAYEWQMNPMAVASKSYVVNDRVAYESAVYHSVVLRRAPISGRVKREYLGNGPSRQCRVWAKLADSEDIVDYTSPAISSIKVQNSPLWKSDPDQQLFYFSVRSFARAHFPDVMMGIYTVDEMMDSEPIIRQSAAPSINISSLMSPKLAEKTVTPQATSEPEQHEPAFELQSDDRRQTEPASKSQERRQTAQRESQAPIRNLEHFLQVVSTAKTVDALDAAKLAADNAWEQGTVDGDDIKEIETAIAKKIATL